MSVLLQIIPMILLLACSGLLSGSETAFFNISRNQLKLFRTSTNKFRKLSATLLGDPKQLLTCLLFGNMAVNVLYFALSSLTAFRLAEKYQPAAGVVFAICSFFAILLFGEILPKSIAYSSSKSFCVIAAPFCFVCVRLLSGILKIFDFIIVAPGVRFFSGPLPNTEPAQAVTSSQLIQLIGASRQRGLISQNENQLFTEVIELGLLKVRHVMRPRVDMVTCRESQTLSDIQKIMTAHKITKIPVQTEEIDKITGILHLRDIMLSPAAGINELIKNVNFVPEQKSVESLLEFFRTSKTDTAIVVDEYGGIAGAVSLEDIVEEIIGPLEPTEDLQPVEQIGPMEYRLDGNLAIHDWANVFGIDPDESRMSTIGGLTTALLGKIPKPGDKAVIKNLTLTVENVKKRRIQTILLSLEPVNLQEDQ
ncbi:MAG: HlyC/CorC family transporter [Planctomycetes bacterium]|nr:HlyC/CorC family transporter [Planctomycetota bacterium]